MLPLPLLVQRQKRRVFAIAISVLALGLTINQWYREDWKYITRSQTSWPAPKEDDDTRAPSTSSLEQDDTTLGALQTSSGWDKSNFVLGEPTLHFQDNLKPNLKYVTAWNFGGMTNDVMVWMNLIYLGLLSNRIPVLFPLADNHGHVGSGPETLSAGKIFDLQRLSQALNHAVLDWEDVKLGRFNHPWEEIDYIMHEDDEVIGCWSIFQALDNSKRPLDVLMPHFLHLDVQYTATPQWVHLNNSDPVNTSFQGLSHLLSPVGRSEALSTQPPLPTHGKHALPPGTPHPQPNDQLACFDSLYWVWNEKVGDSWLDPQSPTWQRLGTHVHFRQDIEQIASQYLRRLFSLEFLPPFITVHIRRTDFLNLCPNQDDLESCWPPLSEYARYVRDIQDELARNNPPDTPLASVTEVVVTSDESDPEWWSEVEKLGWRHTRSYAEEITRLYGKRYPGIIDSVVQASGSGFVGTGHSTMSVIAARRVADWNKGPVRLVEWPHR